MKTKFFDAILEAQKNQRPADRLPPFDLNRLAGGGLVGRLVSRFLENPRWFLTLLRRFKPIAQIGPITVVTRNADVRDILERQAEFQTPFGPEMAEMAKGANFILGMQDGPQYRQMKSACLSAFPVDEVEKKVRPIAARLAREAMQYAEPGFNPVRDLLKMVPARICRDYFGLIIGDEEEFADWSIALSSLFFADFFGDATTRELAVSAADAMNKVIVRSIEAVRSGQVDAETPLARLVAIHDADPSRISIEGIHSVMMGMVSGFVPTDLLGGGNCLDVILSKPEARRALEEAIAAGDDAMIDKAIREAMRFKPINIGPLRHVPKDAVVAKGTSHERVIKAGSVVMPATFSAMFDDRVVANPESYDISRPESDYILFGHGIHWCIGSLIARVQISECLKVLFERPNVRRVSGAKGRLKRLGAFPASLHVDFDIPAEARTAEHSLLTMVANVPAGTDLAKLRTAVAALGNRPDDTIVKALDRTGLIHFASMAVVCRADPKAEREGDPAQLVFELSADGDEDKVLGALAGHAGELLRPVFAVAGLVSAETDMFGFLKGLVIPVGPFPGSNPGLAFAGTPGHSVKRIRAEEELYGEVRGQIRQITAEGTLDAWAILAKVREQITGTSFEWALRPVESHLEKTSKGSWTGALIAASEPRKALAAAIGLLLLLTLFNHVFLFGAPGSWSVIGVLQAVASLAASMVLGAVGILVLVAACAWFLRRSLAKLEAADKPDWSLPDIERYEAIVERENATGAQNHLTGLSVMKAGRLRRFALRLVFFVIRFVAVYVFRPGYLASINTIHFARWVLLPGTDRLLFFSNYGGSWESYLEDFITKANYGLTGVWSNTLGFPRTRDLFFDGATDGDRFKRWARNQQIPTLFWYRAYPNTDTRSIRIHSAVRQGLARARTMGDARDWLSNFGSIPAPPGIVETNDIQSLMFGPMGKLDKAMALVISIPEGLPPAARHGWLDAILSRTSFGDRKPDRDSMASAFGPQGLRRLGLDGAASGEALSQFPSAFRQSMHHETRSRILDDTGANAPEGWLWGNGDTPADALLVIYADDDAHLESLAGAMRDKTAAAGMTVVHEQILTVKKANGLGVEPFGFADGISQPVIDGTPAATRRTHAQHRVATGEFILGYKDQRGYVPPAIEVPAAGDPLNLLATASGNRDEDAASAPRDFGRNGSFLVVRQLRQDVEGFAGYCSQMAKDLQHRPGASSITAD